MKNYFEKLEHKVQKYKAKYANRPRKAAFKLAFWNMLCVFKRHRNYTCFENIPSFPPCAVAFCLCGGLGDIIIGIAYTFKFYKTLIKNDENIKITVFVEQGFDLFKMLGVSKFFSLEKLSNFDSSEFALSVKFGVQFAEIIKEYPHIVQQSKFLSDYVKTIKQNASFLGEYISYKHTANWQYINLITGKNRLTAMDCGSFLNFSENDIPPFLFKPESSDFLKNYGLCEKKFITVQRGVDVQNTSATSTRLWSVDYYNKLIEKIKSVYDVTVVQLGVSEDRCEHLNADINMVGKTDYEMLINLLKGSCLHIDMECGMVHLRHFICQKPSVVLFGPTSPKLKGYSENLNLRSDICNCECCEWLVGDKWQTCCLKTRSDTAPCMEALTPDYVFEKIKESNIL